jgi:hypothetical protein
MDEVVKHISWEENAQEITLAPTPLGMQQEYFPYEYPDTSRKAFHPLQREVLSQFVAGTVCPSRLGPEKPSGKGLALQTDLCIACASRGQHSEHFQLQSGSAAHLGGIYRRANPGSQDLHRGPRIGSGILGIFRLVPKSVVSKSGFRKAAPLSGPSLGT